MGTNTSPHKLLEEMRWAAVLARIAAEDVRAVGLADVFHAATVGGATAWAGVTWVGWRPG